MQSPVSDAQIVAYINEIFAKYDKDRSGGLDALELANFFSDLYRSMGYSVVITVQQAQQSLAAVDTNYDGKASREALYAAFRHILANQSQYLQSIVPIQGQQQYPQIPYQNYQQGNYQQQYQQGNYQQGPFSQQYQPQQLNYGQMQYGSQFSNQYGQSGSQYPNQYGTQPQQFQNNPFYNPYNR